MISGVFLLLQWDIKRMTNQLEDIIRNFGTNELIRSNTHSKILTRFIVKINQLIHLFKQDQQNMLKREKEMKQEITNISHDLRTPLTSIKGFSELLTDPSLSEMEKKEFITIIQNKIDHLIMITDSFYDFSQIDSDDKQLILDQQSLEQIVIETMLMFYNDFEKKQLTVHVDEGSFTSILADKKAISRIVTNIILNALRYAKSYFKIKLIEDEKYVCLRAINNIEQIDRTELNRFFDRTFRLDTSRTGGQLGLGLHIVHQLVEIQDGEVTVEVQNNEFIIEVMFKKWIGGEQLSD